MNAVHIELIAIATWFLILYQSEDMFLPFFYNKNRGRNNFVAGHIEPQQYCCSLSPNLLIFFENSCLRVHPFQ